MVKQMRQNLIAQGREQLCRDILEITWAEASGLFTDIDTLIGEHVIVFSCAQDLESNFRQPQQACFGNKNPVRTLLPSPSPSDHCIITSTPNKTVSVVFRICMNLPFIVSSWASLRRNRDYQ